MRAHPPAILESGDGGRAIVLEIRPGAMDLADKETVRQRAAEHRNIS